MPIWRPQSLFGIYLDILAVGFDRSAHEIPYVVGAFVTPALVCVFDQGLFLP